MMFCHGALVLSRSALVWSRSGEERRAPLGRQCLQNGAPFVSVHVGTMSAKYGIPVEFGALLLVQIERCFLLRRVCVFI